MTPALAILTWLACVPLAVAIVWALCEATGIGGGVAPPPGWDRPPAEWLAERAADRERRRLP